nr:receptor-type tyrosine-protein phosphatase mu-like [Procambarus clarkii]
MYVTDDDTRVRLPLLPDQPHSDYINASYIQGHSKTDAFIASQGPKAFNVDTVGDFWRMIWHTRCPTVVMVTSLQENAEMKVVQYWPEKDQPLFKDGIEVKLVSTEVQLDFVIRKLEVSKTEEVRQVKQYQYTAWPHHGVPHNPYGLAQMIKHITKEPSTGPVTVHCRVCDLLETGNEADGRLLPGGLAFAEILQNRQSAKAALEAAAMKAATSQKAAKCTEQMMERKRTIKVVVVQEPEGSNREE